MPERVLTIIRIGGQLDESQADRLRREMTHAARVGRDRWSAELRLPVDAMAVSRAEFAVGWKLPVAPDTNSTPPTGFPGSGFTAKVWVKTLLRITARSNPGAP